MNFTERNTIEHFFIRQLSGVDLNSPWTDQAETGEQYGLWRYYPADQLAREPSDILLETELKSALGKLNPEVKAQPVHADEVIRKLRAILMSVNVGLVQANRQFAEWLRGEISQPFGVDGKHCNVKLIDFDNPENNSFIITNQFTVRAAETKILDLVLFVNGIPLVVGELKTPVRPAVSWMDGATQIENYERAIPQMFVPNVLSFACDGKELYIGAVRTPLEKWAPWRLDDSEDELSKLVGFQELGQQLTHLLHPQTLMDILRFYSVYGTDRNRKRNKIICRYQQFQGANLLVQRVVEGKIKQGLIWHFQGSGKSLLMLFAAQKLRKIPELKSPTVLIVVDRIDLDSQITASFADADVANFVRTDSIKELKKLLEADTRKIVITTIHKFKDAPANLNERKNIIVMVDEAHRTQEGDLGRTMRSALPNAFLFGLTGTPINQDDRNTFWAFGERGDTGGYLSRYTFQDGLRDNAILKLHFESRLPKYHIQAEELDAAFSELANDLDEEARAKLSQRAVQMNTFLLAPERVRAIVEDIVQHFQERVEPQGFKAMVVTPNRKACVQYKEEMDKLISSQNSKVVMSTLPSDLQAWKKQWGVDKDAQEKIIEEFNQPDSSLQFLIVTAKLLTGFDSPILQTMYLDKSLKDHTLLQAICRTNRLFPQKNFGRIVDYFGVFDDAAKALSFDEESVQEVITNLQNLKDELPQEMQKCLAHFVGVDRSLEGYEGLEAAQNVLDGNEKRDAFAEDFLALHRLWEALSPATELQQFRTDYHWLAKVYESVKPSTGEQGKLLWHMLGAQTTRLVQDHIVVEGVEDSSEEIELNEQVVGDLLESKDEERAEKLARTLISRFKQHTDNPVFRALSERLEALRDKAERGLIHSVQFIKQLCQIATDTLQAERSANPVPVQKSAKMALTELFLELKTEQTPAIVERIVTDIDDIVKVARFDGWQDTSAGRRKIKQALRKTLRKYQLHQDEELFQRAYGYIEQYY